MKFKFIEQPLKYTGLELSAHWIYKNFNLKGDSIVGFLGECEVKIEEMVDISDVLSNSPIYSKQMMHFIVEHFNINLVEGVLRQRLLVNIAKETIESFLTQNEKIIRYGDDLFYRNGKLSVSIAAKSINSVLIHLGINIDANGAPVKAAGLKSELELENIEEIATQIMINYSKECEDIINASCKVRGVF